jgi:EAL domain-containing protein (putative c-di-GMP-specific phosphodiesterase class I)
MGMVRRAVDRGDVALAFQPIVHSSAPGRIAFHEALLRVMDDTGRVIPARDFILSCERHEIGRMLDCLALDRALDALGRARDLRIAVNMSARSIGYPRWMATLHAGLGRDPTLGERLIVEITESSAMLLPELTMSFMADLQARGVAFALDDFGAGYTSFRYLRDFDFDILKIAGEFAHGLADQPDNRVLYQALIAIARQFDMITVAEGVERPQDARLLSQLGVDCMQGYAFGAPALRLPVSAGVSPAG